MIDWILNLLNLTNQCDLDKSVKLSQLFGWLLSGIVTAFLVYFLNHLKEQRYYKNLASLIVDELDMNYYVILHIEGGESANFGLIRNVTWSKLKFDAAKFLPPKQFQSIDITYKNIMLWGNNPGMVTYNDLQLAKSTIRISLSYLTHFANMKLPSVEAQYQDKKDYHA